MIKKVYSFYDSCVGVFSPPMLYMNDEEAKREFGGIVVQDGNKINQFPQHYALFQLGAFNDADGSFVPNELGKIHLMDAIDVLNVVKMEKAQDA